MSDDGHFGHWARGLFPGNMMAGAVGDMLDGGDDDGDGDDGDYAHWALRKEEAVSEDDKKRGLYRKYSVIRLSDPTDKHKSCMKFVLDLDHDPHALPAIKAYIESCEVEYPVLAADLAIALMRRTEKPTS